MKEGIEIKKPPILFDKTQEIINSIAKLSKGDFLSYWVSSNGRIVGEDIIAFHDVIKNNKKQHDTLYLFIKSDGGSGEASLRIINLLRQFYKKIIAYVPLDCASAATMLALGADIIMMGPLSYLSAIDTSITHDLSPLDRYNELVSVSQNELSRVINQWDLKKQSNDLNPYLEVYKYVHPLVIGAVDRATSLSIKITTDILSYHMSDKSAAEKISNCLNSDYPSHSFPITYKEAKILGLNVETLDSRINDLLLKLNEQYSEMAQLAYTDYDQENFHDNEILKVVEGFGIQIFYQKDKDMHYRAEEKRWIPTNDESSWRKIDKNGKMNEPSVFHIR
jgi:hypothetical protein